MYSTYEAKARFSELLRVAWLRRARTGEALWSRWRDGPAPCAGS
jgi:hypothetical protein